MRFNLKGLIRAFYIPQTLERRDLPSPLIIDQHTRYVARPTIKWAFQLERPLSVRHTNLTYNLG